MTVEVRSAYTEAIVYIGLWNLEFCEHVICCLQTTFWFSLFFVNRSETHLQYSWSKEQPISDHGRSVRIL